MKTNRCLSATIGAAALALLLAGGEPCAFGQSKPTIVNHPQGLIVSPGSTVSFTVEATGDEPLRYRWRRSGATLPGETNATLVVSNALVATRYDVVVSNPYGSAVSRYAPLSFFSFVPATNGFGLDLNGVVGAEYVYQLQYATNVPCTNWITLTNLSLPTVPYRFVDTARSCFPGGSGSDIGVHPAHCRSQYSFENSRFLCRSRREEAQIPWKMAPRDRSVSLLTSAPTTFRQALGACLKTWQVRRVRARGLQSPGVSTEPCRPGPLTGRVSDRAGSFENRGRAPRIRLERLAFKDHNRRPCAVSCFRRDGQKPLGKLRHF
jgi:hypothetical protein